MSKRVVGGPTAGTGLYAYDEEGRPLGVYVPDPTQPAGFRVEEEYVHLDGWRPVAVAGMAAPRVFPILSDLLSLVANKRRQMKIVFLLLTGLVALFMIAVCFFTSGTTHLTYINREEKTKTLSCTYSLISQDCQHPKKIKIKGKDFFITRTISVTNLEKKQGYINGWKKRNYCLSMDGEVRQIKSSQQELMCKKDAVFVVPGECYRQDFRDIVDYC